MTHPHLDSAELVRLFDQGISGAELGRRFGVSAEVVRYRLRTAGRKPCKRITKVSVRRQRALRDNFPTLFDLLEFLEGKRAASIARMGDSPAAKTLDSLGELNDYILALREITA